MREITLLVLLLLLAACAISSPPPSWPNGVYTEIQLDETTYQVRFLAKGWTTQEKTGDFALLRSADLCLEKGYSYFITTESKQSQHGDSVAGVKQGRGHKVIQLFKEKPSGFSYNAKYVSQSMRKKYALPVSLLFIPPP